MCALRVSWRQEVAMEEELVVLRIEGEGMERSKIRMRDYILYALTLNGDHARSLAGTVLEIAQ